MGKGGVSSFDIDHLCILVGVDSETTKKQAGGEHFTKSQEKRTEKNCLWQMELKTILQDYA